MNDPIQPNAPVVQPIECNQGADFMLPLTFYNPNADGTPNLASPYNLTGYSFAMSVWDTEAKRSASIVTVTVTNTNLALGQITLSLTNAQTAAIVQGDYYYDLAGTIAGTKYYFMAGAFRVFGRKS